MSRLVTMNRRPAGWSDVELRHLVAALSRRRLLAGSAASGLFAMLAGSETFAQEATPAAGMRIVQTANGPVQVPVNPLRVVCADYYSPFAVFDAGIVPRGAIDGLASNLLPEYLDGYASLRKIGAFGEPDLEAIVDLRPDLIVVSADYSGAYDRLRAIAPTTLFDFGDSGDWPAFSESIADAVGRRDEFATINHIYRERAGVINKGYAATLSSTRWAIVNGAGDQWWLYNPDSSHGLVLSAAGVRFIDEVEGKAKDFVELPYEKIDLLAGADVIIVRANSDGTVNEETRALLDQPLFKSLKAAQAGRVFPLSALFPFSYEMAIRLLDQIEVVASILQTKS